MFRKDQENFANKDYFYVSEVFIETILLEEDMILTQLFYDSKIWLIPKRDVLKNVR